MIVLTQMIADDFLIDRVRICFKQPQYRLDADFISFAGQELVQTHRSEDIDLSENFMVSGRHGD